MNSRVTYILDIRRIGIGMSSSRVSVMVCNLVTSTDLGARAEVRQHEGRPAPAPQGGGRGQQGQLGEVDTPATA